MPQIPLARPGDVDRSRIKVKSLVVLFNNTRDAHAVCLTQDLTGRRWHRPLGGNIELGETARDAAVREIREELDTTIEPPRLLTVLENIFELNGELGHEVDFIYGATLPDGVVPVDGRTFTEGWVEWRPIQADGARSDTPLYPVGLQQVIAGQCAAPSP